MSTVNLIAILTLYRPAGDGLWYGYGAHSSIWITKGVKEFVEAAGQTELLAWAVSALPPLSNCYPWLRIELTSSAGQALLSVTDEKGKRVTEDSLSWPDQQVGRWIFYWTDRVLLLSGEY